MPSFFRLRMFLVRWLVGKDAVILNAKFTGSVLNLEGRFPSASLYVAHSEFFTKAE